MISLDDLTMYAYGLLDEPAVEAMAEHLKTCKPCTQFVDLIHSEHRLFEGALAREIPDTMTRMTAVEEVLARRHPPKRHPERPPTRSSRTPLAILRPATFAAIAHCLVLFLSRSEDRPPMAAQVQAPATTWEPAPDALLTSSGTNSAPPGAVLLRTVL